MASNLNTLVNQVVAFTGRAWKPRPELRKLVRRLGASVTPRSDVTDQTTVLVRGNCAVWRFGDYGRKELRAAQLLRKGRRIVVVHDFEFRKLVENGRPARASDRISGQPVEWLKAPNVRQFENVAVLSGPLNRESTAHGRVEQGYLRRRLFGEADDGECYLCGRSLPTSLLIAAHIKPRSECSRRERLDADNVVFYASLDATRSMSAVLLRSARAAPSASATLTGTLI